MHDKHWHTIVFIVSILLAGCAQPRVSLHPSMRSIDPDHYEKAFESWSREISVLPFNGMDNVLTARATYRSHEFRRYFAARVSSDLVSTPEEKAALEAKELESMNEGHEFYVTLMSAVLDCDELAPDEGPWTIRLKNDRGDEVAPALIEEVENPLPQDAEYYRFDPKLRKAYRIRFPLKGDNGTPIIEKDTRYFELSFASALGRDSARWEAR